VVIGIARQPEEGRDDHHSTNLANATASEFLEDSDSDR